MRTHGTAQAIGGRSEQCDATAVRSDPDGTRAYVLLDGIGSTPEVRDWTRAAAVRLARSAVSRGDAETALRAAYDRYATERAADRGYVDFPQAAAVVAVTAPGRPLTIAWCGDSRAYVLLNGHARRLTADHNLRRVHPGTDRYPYSGNRNVITSCLGSGYDDATLMRHYNHPAIETATFPALPCRLLLASDGAYEPFEDTGTSLADHLAGAPTETARTFVAAAVDLAGEYPDNATALVADLRP